MVGKPVAWSIVALLSAAAFGFLLWGVLAHNGLTLADAAVATFIARHRLAWLTPVMELVTWLGSSFFIIPFGVAVGGYLWRRRRSWRPLVMMAVAFLGAAGLYDIVKPAVGRARPAAALQVDVPDVGNRRCPRDHRGWSVTPLPRCPLAHRRLGGYALGLAWLSLVMITSLLLAARRPRH